MINLIPTEVKTSIRYARYNTALIGYGVIAVLVVVLIAGVLFFGFTIASADESSLQESIAQKESDLNELVAVEGDASDLADKIDTVGKLLDREVKFSEVLQEIGSILPEGAILTSLRLTNSNEEPLRIAALVDTKNNAAVLRQNIEDSDRFTGADIEGIVVNLDENGEPDGFAVTVIASPTNLGGEEAPAATNNGGSGGQQE